jgi:HD-GYP domain-containing protein (c-di-GMP phosphodiesterase class II)
MDLGAGLIASDAEKLKLLLNVGKLISGRLELKPLVQEVMRQASMLVSADRSTLWLYDPDRDDIFTYLGEGLAMEVRLPLGKGVAGTAALHRETILVNDAYASPYFDPETDKRSGYRTHNLLAVPMESHDGRLLGVVQAVNRLGPNGTAGQFTEEDIELLTAMAGFAAVAVENAMLYTEQKRQFDSFIVTLAQSVDARDPTTSNHTRMVTGIAVAIARQMGLSEERVERIRIAAILHDYGKIGVPDSVLLKPGKHDAAEKRMMHSHVLKTILILSRISFRRDLRDIPRIAGMHHEKLSGEGYPFGLKEEEIPLEGRILAVADVFQALTQTRPYKAGRTPSEALAECEKMTQQYFDHYGGLSGVHLDANVVRALHEVLVQYGEDVSYFGRLSGWDEMLS